MSDSGDSRDEINAKGMAVRPTIPSTPEMESLSGSIQR